MKPRMNFVLIFSHSLNISSSGKLESWFSWQIVKVCLCCNEKKFPFWLKFFIQGGDTLLTDPQIITHPRYGQSHSHHSLIPYIITFYSISDGVFTSGNLSKNWEAFLTHHQCTAWCEYYQLPCDYDEWDKAGNATTLQLKLRNLKAEPAIEISDSNEQDQSPLQMAMTTKMQSRRQDPPDAMSIRSIINPL